MKTENVGRIVNGGSTYYASNRLFFNFLLFALLFISSIIGIWYNITSSLVCVLFELLVSVVRDLCRPFVSIQFTNISPVVFCKILQVISDGFLQESR